jgi:hypothetical protein
MPVGLAWAKAGPAANSATTAAAHKILMRMRPRLFDDAKRQADIASDPHTLFPDRESVGDSTAI